MEELSTVLLIGAVVMEDWVGWFMQTMATDKLNLRYMMKNSPRLHKATTHSRQEPHNLTANRKVGYDKQALQFVWNAHPWENG